MEHLTPRQKEVLEFIISRLADCGCPPTLREIGAHLRVSGTLGVMKHLAALERKGYIRKSAGSSRGITVTSPGSGSVLLPVAGTVRAGMLQPAEEDIAGYFAIDRSQQAAGGAFFLRVQGDSMVNVAILEGDLALVRPQSTAANGEIVVAMVDGEATLKRFYLENERIRLQPQNPAYAPIVIGPADGEVTIVGKVIGIYRQL